MTDANGKRRRRLRVASYNVHACIGTDGVFAPSRIADVLGHLDADVIALQEVEDRRYREIEASRFLADSLGLHVAGRTAHKRGAFDYGNVLLSRVPPSRSAVHDLAYPRREPRGAIEADFVVDGCSLRVIATHFGLVRKERRAQLQKVLACLENPQADLVVLCADFNEWLPFSHLHRTLGRALGAAPALRTFPSRLPSLRLDRIYASPVAALAGIEAVSTADARRASDHLPIVADFDLAKIGPNH